ncbi:SigE family RNA polymerase sigma factor [Kribbella sandramycini]|uniref:RNA polymerase sigma-70 factor (Sigma-E family) n=1 Tax=Kribbella sandramycini TaxID=60450 RepID=A0A7Y4L4T3_9ACTN|nr:SigE family RNA polymerase sigma factor [Kribbella sandramycini]MBB6571663.1 RNA polymerase sigma-70 factor (sigma-E family) [Kribbella sandramycini]NOL44308.1 SigE family RNA polymerase sigma factor [Kribbella sandramycini]
MKSDVEQDYVDFVRHQANALCRTAYLLCGDWRRAEDATQEALIRMYRIWSRIQRKGSVSAYARKVVVSTTLDGLRRKSSQEVVGDSEMFSGQPDPADPLGVLENRMVITEALATLPPRQRACVVLRYFDELTVEETAIALDCRPGTVKSQTMRALEKLREHPALRHFSELAGMGG